MTGKCAVFGVMLAAASAGIILGCKGESGAGKTAPAPGASSAVSIADSFAYTESLKDPFNPTNGVESTRKTRPAAFGSYTGKLPDPTPTMESLGATLNPPNRPKMNVGVFENYLIKRTSFPFDYETDSAALKSLAALHSIEKILKKDSSELENLAALCEYTRRFLDGGTPPKPGDETGPSAFLITKNRREKGIGGGSDVYAALMCQLALSAGYDARLTGAHCLDQNGNPLVQDVCEVFLTSYDKWVAFDPFDRGSYFLRNNIPLSALELHILAAGNRLREITPVCGSGEILDIMWFHQNVLPRFRYVYIWRMNDILGRSPRNGSIPWSTLYQAHLVWEDPNSPVGSGGFDKIDRFAGGVKYVTHTRTDFEWSIGGVTITVERTGDSTVRCYFDTFTPNFQRFDLSLGDKPARTGNVLNLEKAATRVVIASVNSLGKRGRTSLIEFAE